MKPLYESLLTGKVAKPSAKVQPSSKEELQQLIDNHIDNIDPHPGQKVDFNWIDISEVDNLRCLFDETKYIPVIDEWKIDHVKNFGYMFAYNKYIKTSPLSALPEKLLADRCCEGMFFGCSSLVTPPELPATTLTSNCYANLFSGCSSLVTPPKLPSTKLAESCYNSMFWKCTSLKYAPELPALDLADDCYRCMFSECKNLKKAPKLPAVKMKSCCYWKMFEKCTSLTIPPDLPAEDTVVGCYSQMFSGCTSLKRRAIQPDNRNNFFNMYDDCPKIKD